MTDTLTTCPACGGNRQKTMLDNRETLMCDECGAYTLAFCPSCGVPWDKHMGIAGTCAKLQQARDEALEDAATRVNELSDIDPVTKLYVAAAIRGLKGRP